MKKFLKASLVILLLFIPTYIAIYLYMSVSEAPVQTSSVYAMKLTAPDGEEYNFDNSKTDDKPFIDFFLDINKTAKSVPSLPEGLKNADKYTVTYYSFNLQTQYSYYFSKTKPSNSYLVDHNGNVSRIDARATIDFLDSKYSSALYKESSQTPNLNVGGSVILPLEFNWKYFTYSSKEHTVSVPLAESTPTLDLSFLSVPMGFDRAPEASSVTITNQAGENLFSGTIGEYSSLLPVSSLIREDSILDVTIEASWKSTGSSGFEGNALYKFKINCIYDPPSRFWLGESFIEEGEFVVISGANVEDPEAITFTSSPSIDYEPVFYKEGDCVRALIPIKLSLNLSSQTVKFTLGYDGDTTTLELFIKESSLTRATKKFSSDKVNISARNDKNLEEFVSFVTANKSESVCYFNGKFIFDHPHGLRASFGDTINYPDNDSSFTSGGLALLTYKNGKLLAVNDGKVAAVGETAYGGNTVVVDHGLGLRSVYYCIRELSVEVGDIVKAGEEIGIGSAKNGFTDGSMSYIELWVEDVPVSYFPLLESGRTSCVVFSDPK